MIVFYIVWLAVATGLLLGGLVVRATASAEASSGLARLMIRTGAFGLLLAGFGLAAFIARHK